MARYSFWLLFSGVNIPRLFFNYRLPANLRALALIAYLIVSGLLLFWPAKRRPEQGSQKPIAGGGGLISN
jgi:hypothetical protein